MNKKIIFKTYMLEEIKVCPYSISQAIFSNMSIGSVSIFNALQYYNGTGSSSIEITTYPVNGTVEVIGTNIKYTSSNTSNNGDIENIGFNINEDGCSYPSLIRINLYKLPTFTITYRSPVLDNQGEQVVVDAIGGLPNQIIDFTKTLNLFGQKLTQLTLNTNLPALVTNNRTSNEVGTVQLKPDGTLKLTFLMIAEPDTTIMYCDFLFTYFGITLNPNGYVDLSADGSET